MGIKLDSRDVKSELIFPKILEEELYPLQIEDITKILSAASYDKRGMYLAQISSGMRLGEIVQIRKKDLVLDSDRIMVKIPAKITKSQQARTTFLSKEAEKMIRHTLKKLDDDDLVWGNNPIPLNNEIAEITNLHRYLSKCGLDMKYDSGQYKINTHSFRAFFITKISRHDPNFAKKLAGQKGYLLQYDRMTDREKLDKYLEIEKDLIIDPTERQKARISKLERNEEEFQELKTNQKKDKETLILLTQLYMYETTEPLTPTKKAHEEDDQMRKELRGRLKKLVTSNDLLVDLLEERARKTLA